VSPARIVGAAVRVRYQFCRPLIDSLQRHQYLTARSSLRSPTALLRGGLDRAGQRPYQATRWSSISFKMLTATASDQAGSWRQIDSYTNQTWSYLAGFMRYTDSGLRGGNYSGRLLNIHPSCCPSTKVAYATAASSGSGRPRKRAHRALCDRRNCMVARWSYRPVFAVEAGDTPAKSGGTRAASRSTYFPAGNALV